MNTHATGHVGTLLQEYADKTPKDVPFIAYVRTEGEHVWRAVFEGVPIAEVDFELMAKLDRDFSKATGSLYRALRRESTNPDKDELWLRAFRHTSIVVLSKLLDGCEETVPGDFYSIRTPMVNFILWRLGQTERHQSLVQITPVSSAVAIVTPEKTTLDRLGDRLKSVLAFGHDPDHLDAIIHKAPIAADTAMFAVVLGQDSRGVCFYTPLEDWVPDESIPVEVAPDLFYIELLKLRQHTQAMLTHIPPDTDVVYEKLTDASTLWDTLRKQFSEGDEYPNALFTNLELSNPTTHSVGLLLTTSYLKG